MRGLTHTWNAIGTTCSLTVSEPSTIIQATAIAHRIVAQLDLVASRFRPDSELSRINAASAGARVVTISPELVRLIDAAIEAAHLTDGCVDPTVGAQVLATGYDADFAQVQTRAGNGAAAGAPSHFTFRDITLDRATRTLSLPAGVMLDLGAIAKAAAADDVAGTLAATLPGGFLVNLGGDLAVAGELPPAGWPIGVAHHDGHQLQTVVSHGQAFATSSTGRRTWLVDGERRHHIVDPSTGRSAHPVWTQVTCAAGCAAHANAAATASIVLGADAPHWLTANAIPARLDHRDGHTTFTPGWPIPSQELAA